MGKLVLDTKLFEKKMKKFARQDPKRWKEALEKAAVQFLTWANTGQGNSSKKPPIKLGVLRGSSYAFVGTKIVGTGGGSIEPPGQKTMPPTNPDSDPMNVTWVWDTEYAHKMHEWDGGWGEMTLQDGDAGNKWLEEHLKSDRELFTDVITKFYKKKAKT